MKKLYKINLDNSIVFWTDKIKEDELKSYFPVRNIIFPVQEHSNLIYWVENEKKLICDGIFTREEGVLIGIKTADCVPLIISNKNFVGALHCGWKGLSLGILKNMEELIKKEKSSLKECLFFLGPSICGKCYEVKDDVGLFFSEFFKKGKLDLKGFILDFLIKKGVPLEKVIIDKNCTFCNKSLPSYRREKSSGRILTGIIR